MTLRTRTRPDEFDPLDWVLEHWQQQNRPAAEHFVAASSLFRTYQAVTARFDEVLSEYELTRTGYLLLATLFLSGDRARPLSYLSRHLLVHPPPSLWSWTRWNSAGWWNVFGTRPTGGPY